VHPVGSYCMDISLCTVNKILNKTGTHLPDYPLCHHRRRLS